MYLKRSIPFSEIPHLSSRDKAYQGADPRLRPFYRYDVQIDQFSEVIEQRSSFEVDRELLVNELRNQYADIETSLITRRNIDALRLEDTFTVVTAHQPSLLTGPLYFIYKICSTISLASRINEELEKPYIVPVLVMGGEDHDFEEIASINLFGKRFTWQTDQLGATGRMMLNGLDQIIEDIKRTLGGGEYAFDLINKLEEALASSKTYGDFMIRFVDSLFNRFGLIIINMDNEGFKKKLVPYVQTDIETKISQISTLKDQASLEKAGFKSQAHARAVNIFWLTKTRDRVIENEDGTFTIGQENFTSEELNKKVLSDPSCVSPNVILRPLYQEIILPNLAYVGGGGELAYWMERKSLFTAWDIPFPMLVRRDSVFIVDKKTSKWLEDRNLSILSLFEREEQLISQLASINSAVDIDLSEYKSLMDDLYKQIENIAQSIDPTLKQTVAAESKKSNKSLDYLESKLLKAEKNKSEVAIKKLVNIKNKLFPGNNGLQERHVNFMEFYVKYGPEWLEKLLQLLDPLDKNFKVLIEK